MENIREQLIKDLIEIKAVEVRTENPFVWTSGIQSPIYCDNRKTIGHYPVRRNIANGMVELIKANFPDAEIIGGTATAGIPHSTSVADTLELPLVYFRSKPKEHGTKSAIEGDFQKGQKIVIVEDLISTGGSVLQAVEYAREAGMEVLGVVAIFSYELGKATDAFAGADVTCVSIATFTNLLAHYDLTEEEKAKIAQWQVDPFDKTIW